jgi:tRNA1(Val) A37 N6-methylase TrmN6
VIDGDVPLTRETPAPGLVVWQPKRGYRFGVEVYALAAFALGGGVPATAIDLGCGSGVVGLLLAWHGVRVTGVDREPRWTALARRSAAESGVPAAFVDADVRAWDGARADLVVCNPPWFPPDEPRSPDPWKAASRSMIHGDVRAFAEAGLRLAPRVCLVTRRERERDLVGLPLARRARLGEEVVLLELRAGAAAVMDEPLDLPAAYALFGR